MEIKCRGGKPFKRFPPPQLRIKEIIYIKAQKGKFHEVQELALKQMAARISEYLLKKK